VSEAADSQPTGTTWSTGWPLLLVVLLALSVRVGYVLTRPSGGGVPGRPDETALAWDDARHYHRIARNILEGRGLGLDGDHQVERPPAYPLFLAALYFCNRHLGVTDDFVLVRLAQAVLDTLTVVLIWWMAAHLFGRRSGLLAALLAALYPFSVFYTGLLLSETLAVFFVALTLALLVRAFEAKQLSHPLAAGAALGLLCLTRSSFLLAPVLLVPIWCLLRRRWRRGLAQSLLILLAWAVVMLPWVVRNARLTGHFVPGTLTAGWSLYEAAGPEADGGPRMERTPWPAEVWPREGSPLDEYQADRHLLRLAREHMLKDPGRTARLALVKLRRLWNPFPNVVDYRSPVYLVVSVLGYAPVMLLAALAVVLKRRQWRQWLVLVLPALYLSGIHAVFVGSIRYRVPAMPGLIVLAGAAGATLVAAFWRWVVRVEGRRPRWPWVVLAILVLMAAAAVIAARVLLRPENIQERLRGELARVWGGPVAVGEANFGPFKGLEAHGVELFSPQAGNLPILTIDRLEASYDRGSLARGELELTEVRLRGGRLRLRRGRKGWDFPTSLLQRRGRRGKPVPRIVVRNLELLFQRPRPVDAAEETVSGPQRASQAGWGTSDWGTLSAQTEVAEDGSRVLRFHVRGDTLGDWHGRVNVPPGGERVQLTASCPEFVFDKETLAALPGEVVHAMGKFALEGRAEIDLSAELSLTGETGSSVVLEFSGPSLAYYKFPYRVPWTRARVRFEQGLAFVEEGQGREGDSRLSLTGMFSLPGQPKQVELKLLVDGGYFSDKLRDCLPTRYHKLWNDLRPDGRFDLNARIYAEDGPDPPTKLSLDIDLQGSSVNYTGFPYRVGGLSGHLSYRQGTVRISGVSGAGPGGSPVHISGEMTDLGTPAPTPRIVVKSGRLALDEHLRRAFAPRYRRLWDRLSLSGYAAAECLVHRPEKDGPVEVQVTGELLGVEVTDRGFPYTLSGLHGAFSYGQGTLQLDRLQGTHGLAQVEVTGQVHTGAETQARLTVTGTGVLLDEDLRQLLPPGVQTVWRKLNLAGRVSVTAELAGEPEELTATIGMSTTDGSLCYDGFPYPLTGLAGELQYDKGRLSWDLKSAQGPTTVSTYGTVTTTGNSPEARWGIEARNLVLDETLQRAMAEQPLLERIWDHVEIDPGARGDVHCRLRYRDGTATMERVEVELLEGRVIYRPLPYPFERVSGTILYDVNAPDLLTLKNVRGQRGGGWLEIVKGSIDSLEDQPSFELELSASDIPLDDELRDLLPPGHREFWDRLAPAGWLNFPNDVLTVSGGPFRGDRVITYNGHLGLKDVSFVLGMAFEEVTGKLTLSDCELVYRQSPGGEDSEAGAQVTRPGYHLISHRYGGTGRLNRMVAGKRPLTAVTGSFRKEGTMLGFSDLEAGMYGGRMTGAVRLELEPERVTYGCRLDLQNVALGPFVRDTFDYRGQELIGRLAGDIILQGTGTERTELVGLGDLSITDGELYRMPLLLRILSLLQLSASGEAAFSRARVNYAMLDGELLINDLVLSGHGLRIFGDGTVTKHDRLELTLYTGFGRGELPHVPLVSDLAELLGKQLARLEVGGTFDEPEVVIEPLTPLSAPLIDLFRMLTK